MSKKSQEDWDNFWLHLAKQYSTGSKDPRTKVGALIVHGKRLYSAGYNGFNQDHEDPEEMYLDRDVKNNLIIHAEINALNFYTGPKGATMYIFGLHPCLDCAAEIVSDGRIDRVVSFNHYKREFWQKSMDAGTVLLKRGGIDVCHKEIMGNY